MAGDTGLLYPEIEKRFNVLFQEIGSSPHITEGNKLTIEEFIETCKAKGLSVQRRVFYLDRLKLICKVVPNKNFKAFSHKDVQKVPSV
ncbi:MAG: hypothetical protein HYX24_06125 [Candidatus Aenigmarchaeota archaeon]|nr:hypothetical protein [Candidatus Aenigmarchaeota archaeon]